MVGKVEHIGIAVSDLQASIQLYTKLLGIAPYKTEEVASENVMTAFFLTGVNKIELLQATNPSSAIASFIEKRGEGIHHIAFHVEDIEAEMQRMKDNGFRLLQEKPKPGADNKLICFVHPKDAGGVLMELCQEKP
ncbi:MAG: methylmalonyl-CoA epimerase [Flavobacteriales bacterium]|nr:methylmalonyl-CoA epimerase [Flavobacteriales bacterium]